MAGKQRYGANVILESLINHEVNYVFGIPGAKIDRLFEVLEHSDNPKKPQLIIARHEQGAAFMASGIGRITGKPGVVMTTSGPGVSNLATGVVTATAEGDPVLAISGQVQRADLLRLTHQSMANAALMAPITNTVRKSKIQKMRQKYWLTLIGPHYRQNKERVSSVFRKTLQMLKLVGQQLCHCKHQS